MRQHLIRGRQSRDQLRRSFENTVKNIEANAKNIKTVSWQDLQRIEQLLCQKDIQIQQMHSQHAAEIEKLHRKLNLRDETMKKVLLNKVKSLRKMN